MKRSLFVALLLLFTAAAMLIVSLATTPALAGPPLQASPTPRIELEPENPTPTPARPLIGTPPPGGGAIEGTPVGGPPRFDPPPTLDELIEQFPDLKPYLEQIEELTADQIDLAELYRKVVQIYNARGASGVAAFLKDSGILEKLGLPLAYLDLLTVYDTGGLEAVDELARERGYINDADEVIGYLALDSRDNYEAVRATLEDLGVGVYQYLEFTDEIEIGIPLDILAQYQTPGTLLGYLIQIATAEHVVGFRGPAPQQTNTGPVAQGTRTVGAQTIGADAWHAAGITGKGIRVGVLDMGFGGIKSVMGSALPTNLVANVDLDALEQQRNNHGTACAMVVHGAAPDAELYIAYFDGNSRRSLIEAMEFLAQNKVQVVNYSVSSLIGPRDGTSANAQLVEAFVRETGILWVNSAGNYALSHTAYRFNPGERGVHFFAPEVNLLPFKTFAPVTVVAMNWDGNWAGGENTEYIFIILDQEGKEVVTAAEPRRGQRNQYPFQIASFRTNPGDIYYMLVARTRGNTENVMDIFIPDAVLPDWARVPLYTVTSPGDASSVLTVGATGLTEDQLEPYSSQGPTTDERLKPDISAPTGEVVPGYDRGFSGTSGAAPLVAGAAALAMEVYPNLSPAEIKAFLMTNIIDLGESGPDVQFGTGRLALTAPSAIDPDKVDRGREVVPGGPATARITNIDTKFNVRVQSQVGMVIAVSFDLENFKGRQIVVAAIFGDEQGRAIPAADEKYSIGGGVGTGVIFSVGANQTTFRDVSLFIPNSAFANIPPDATRIQYLVGILDPTDPQNPQRLAVSEPGVIRIRR